jgi:hypothetical protein
LSGAIIEAIKMKRDVSGDETGGGGKFKDPTLKIEGCGTPAKSGRG